MFHFEQSRETMTITWTVKSLNIVIGQIGGYIALIWIIIRFIFDGYESFKFTNSVIGRVYACTAEGPDAPVAETKAESQQAIQQTLTSHSQCWYTYRELNFSWLL